MQLFIIHTRIIAYQSTTARGGEETQGEENEKKNKMGCSTRGRGKGKGRKLKQYLMHLEHILFTLLRLSSVIILVLLHKQTAFVPSCPACIRKWHVAMMQLENMFKKIKNRTISLSSPFHSPGTNLHSTKLTVNST